MNLKKGIEFSQNRDRLEFVEESLNHRFSNLLDRLSKYEESLPTGLPAPNDLSSSNFSTLPQPINVGLEGAGITSALAFFVYRPPKESPYYAMIIAEGVGRLGYLSISPVNFKLGFAAYDEHADITLGRIEELLDSYERAAAASSSK